METKMTLWQIQATRGTSEQVPTFYLDAQVQGILNEEKAIKVARDILGFDALSQYRIRVMAINYTISA